MDGVRTSVTFCYDSKWAASMVTGKFRAKRKSSSGYKQKLRSIGIG